MKILQKLKCIILSSIVILFILSHTAVAVTNYPIKGWQKSAPEDQGMQSQLLSKMLENVKASSYKIDSVSIIRNGYIILDAYFYPYSERQKHLLFSCTKSIMSALIGIAVDKGYIENVNQPIMEFFPDDAFADADDLKKSITLKNLLTMTSGLKCKDSYLYRWVGLFNMRRSNDWTQHVLDIPMSESPGEKFEYCNGASFLLSAILQNATNMKSVDFARRHLFEPLGIIDVDWERSPEGVDAGYGEMMLKPHDMAKFGWLFLNKGRWGNRQIISKAWVEDSTRGHINGTLSDQYGYQWWVVNSGYYLAIGAKGQRIYIIPEKNLVVVFTSDQRGRTGPVLNGLINDYIIPAASSSTALPQNEIEYTQLEALAKSVAKPIEFIWTSESEGIAKDGVFKRTESPAFQFQYPLGSKKLGIKHSGQVMKMKTLGEAYFSAFVVDIPVEIKLEDFGPKYYAKQLEQFGTDVKVVSNKETILKDGTKAYQTQFSWLWNKFVPETTYLVSSYKDGKCVYLWSEAWRDHNKLEPIVQSLFFQ